MLFLDTADFRLYNNAFILRRRIPYSEGFPVGDPEIVFKFRHPDIQKTAETDVRPNIRGDFRIKFKAEALPLKDRLGGMRLLFSHNVEFGLSALEEGDHTSLETIVHMLPALSSLKRTPGEKVELVGGTIVEEVLQDIGILDFGAGITAVANVALWRSRGEHRPLIGEFAFQIKFKRREDLNEQALQRAEAFFLGLQNAAKDWIALGATKTGVAEFLICSPPSDEHAEQGHEAERQPGEQQAAGHADDRQRHGQADDQRRAHRVEQADDDEDHRPAAPPGSTARGRRGRCAESSCSPPHANA